MQGVGCRRLLGWGCLPPPDARAHCMLTDGGTCLREPNFQLGRGYVYYLTGLAPALAT
jgi:hypothetical protein